MSSSMQTLTLSFPSGTSPLRAQEKTRLMRDIDETLSLPGEWLSLLGNTIDSTIPRQVLSPDPYQALIGWYPKWKARLDSIRSAAASSNDTNWPRPSALALSKATDFLERLHERDKPPSNISQSALGGVAFTFLRGDTEIFVEFLNSGSVYAAISKTEDLDGDFPTYRLDEGDFGIDSFIDLIPDVANA